jgi:crotonobetainyl-CoA:carnitine CoA-transferase CaiB-like acyl-CoA transferase
MPHQPASSALSHITVLDVARVKAGPAAVRQLADWGADVIKVEMPTSLEADGTLGAMRHSPDFQNMERNKRSVTINLKEPDGLAIFMRLVAKADVVVENFRPDVKNRLGINYEDLRKVNPRIILASVSGFGQTGPYATRPGLDQIAQGMGGLMSVTGKPGEGPLRAGVAISDLSAGLFCAAGTLVALLEREKSGQGQWVHTSLLESLIFMLDFQTARWLNQGEIPVQEGNNHPTRTPTGMYPTQDGYMNIAVSGERAWSRFCTAVGAPEWLDIPEYQNNDDRWRRREEVNEMIGEKTRERPTKEWIKVLLEAGVPCGEIYTVDQVFADPQVQHLGVAEELETHAFGKTRFVGQPVALERTPSALTVGAPDRGEHTDEILADVGFSPDEIADLRGRNVI